MFRCKLKELIGGRECLAWRHVTLQVLLQATGINRNKRYKMLNRIGASVRSDDLDRLGSYFDCSIEKLVEYLAESIHSSNNGKAKAADA